MIGKQKLPLFATIFPLFTELSSVPFSGLPFPLLCTTSTFKKLFCATACQKAPRSHNFMYVQCNQHIFYLSFALAESPKTMKVKSG